MLVALRRPDLVRGIVGLSADPDFTEGIVTATIVVFYLFAHILANVDIDTHLVSSNRQRFTLE